MKPITLATAIVLLLVRALAQTNGPGNAVQFNGSDSFVFIGTIGSLTGTFTVELWAQPNISRPTNLITLVSSRYPDQFGFDLQLSQYYPYNLVSVHIGDGSQLLQGGGYYPITTNAWHHLAVVVTPTNYIIYANGMEAGSDTNAPNNPVLYDSNHYLHIGSKNAGDYMNGLIDEVRVWNTARSQSQIQASMNCSLSGSETGLMGYWRFDEGSGFVTADSSGHAFDGYFGNLVGWVPSTAPIAGPPVVNTAPATSLTAGSATLNGTVFTNNHPVEAWFEYGTTTNYGGISPVISISPISLLATNVSYSLNCLNAATLYHFRLVASNQTCCIAFGPDLTFTTLPAAQQTNILLTSITPGTEQVQLVTNGDFQDAGTPDSQGAHPFPTGWLRFGDMYVAAGSNMVGVDQGLVARGLATGTNSASGYYTWVGLEPETEYVLSAYLWNFGDATNHVTTGVDLSCPEPQLTLSSSNLMADHGYFAYSHFKTSANGVYIVRCFYDDLGGTGAAPPYYPWAAQWDNIAITTANLFQPPFAAHAPVVTTLATTNVSPFTAVLNGTVLPRDQPTGAWFQYGSTTNYENSTPVTPIAASNTTAVALGQPIFGLFPGFVYHFRLVGTNIAGASFGTDQMFTTPLVEAVYPTPYTFVTVAGSPGSGRADGIGRTAQFGPASAVAVDINGNLFVADGELVRKLTPAGVVTTIAGFPGSFGMADGTNAAARFSSLTGIAVDGGGNLYVTDNYANTIRKIAPLGGTNWVVTTIAGLAGTTGNDDGTNGAARFSAPSGIALDGATNLYVSEYDNYYYDDYLIGKLRKITPIGTNWIVSTIASELNDPLGIAVDSNTNLYVVEASDVLKFAPVGNNWIVSTQANLISSGAIAVDSNTNLYVTYVNDTGSQGLIRKFTPNAVITTLAGSTNGGFADGVGTNALFTAPKSIAITRAGDLYVTDSSTIRLVTSVGLVRTLAGVGPAASAGYADGNGQSARFKHPYGIALDCAGNVYVADTENATIRQITTAGIVSTLAGLTTNSGSADGVGDQARFSAPQGVAADDAGNVYVADTGNSTIRKITPSGVVTTLAGLAGSTNLVDGPGSTARFASPVGIALDKATNLYVADQLNYAIRKVTPSGDVTTIAGPGTPGGLPRPIGVAVDAATNLYVTDPGGHTILRVTPAVPKWVVTTIGGRSGYLGDADGPGTDARFAVPSGIAVDGSSNVFVMDQESFTVRKLSPSGTNWIVTTLAGLVANAGSADGTGSDARFGADLLFADGIAVDPAGNLYVADAGNNTIRKGFFSKFAAVNAVAYTPPPMNSQLTVALLPEMAVAAGAKWRFPWELGWRESGTAATNLAPGSYDIEFRSPPGWLAFPPGLTGIAIEAASTNLITTNVYYPTISSVNTNSGGSLTVYLGPNPPLGAGWRFLGDTISFLPSGYTTNLLPGAYLIEFAGPFTNRSTPRNLSIQISAGVPTVVSVNYSFTDSAPPEVLLPFPVPAGNINDLTHYPFGFNGQLQTDAGYGSGVAVQPNVVLTAAHLVFNDETLSYARQAYWFFQREAGVAEPAPLLARAWYLLSSYSARGTNSYSLQRINDRTGQGGQVYLPDQSSPESRNLDVAALYFHEPVAGPGGGYGGYLPSDAVPNSWLVSTSLKMLVGYPVDGSLFGLTTLVPGRMYQTDPQPYPLSLAPDVVNEQQEVYSAPWFLGLPGNSGGPLYVQFNGYYYPAGVYLGTLYNGSTYSSAVRAIDSNVVALISIAQADAGTGTNNTGGGPITFIPTAVSASNPALVQVLLGPKAAIQAGASWGLSGDTSFAEYNNDLTRAIGTNGASLIFKPLDGWNDPTNQTVQIYAGVINVISNVFYTVTPPKLVLTSSNGLALTGTTGTAYQVQYSTNLAPTQWLSLSTNTLPSSGSNLVLHFSPSNGPAAFYRAVWLP